MQNPTEKCVIDPLAAMLAFTALAALMQGAFSKNMGQGFSILFKVLASFSAFVWYCRDSDAHGYRRSLWRNILFNAVGFVFVPVYLLRTRPSGQRFAAMLSFGNFCALMLAALMLGAVIGIIIRKLF